MLRKRLLRKRGPRGQSFLDNPEALAVVIKSMWSFLLDYLVRFFIFYVLSYSNLNCMWA